MPLLIRCTSCDAKYRVPETALGKTVTCKSCGVKFKAATDTKPVDEVSDNNSEHDREDDRHDSPPKKDKDRANESSRKSRDDRPNRSGSKKRRESGSSKKIWWIAGGATVLVALIVVGILLLNNRNSKVKKINDDNAAALDRNSPRGQFESAVETMKQGKGGYAQYLTLENTPIVQDRKVEVAKLLEPGLQHSEDSTATAAATAMRRWGSAENIPALLTALKTLPEQRRRPRLAVISALGVFKEPSVIPTLVAEFKKDFQTREAAGHALAEIGPASESAVLNLMVDPDSAVRDSAYELFPRLNPKRDPYDMKLDRYTAALKSDPEWIRKNTEALNWFWASDPKPSVSAEKRTAAAVALGQLLKSIRYGPGNGTMLYVALKRWATKENVPALAEFLNPNTDAEARRMVIEILGQVKDDSSVKALVTWLVDGNMDRIPTSAAVQNIGSMAEMELHRTLKVESGDGPSVVQLAGVRLLKSIGTEKSLPALQEMLTQPNAKSTLVGKAAVEAIDAINARKR